MIAGGQSSYGLVVDVAVLIGTCLMLGSRAARLLPGIVR